MEYFPSTARMSVVEPTLAGLDHLTVLIERDRLMVPHDEERAGGLDGREDVLPLDRPTAPPEDVVPHRL